jgi:hypothetical protein
MPRKYHNAKEDILQSMPGTISQLVEKSGYHRATVERWMAKLRDGGESHIIKWLPPNGSGHFIPVHARGPGKDAECTLKAQTHSDRWKRAKQLHGLPTLRAKERARYWSLRARRGETMDPLVAALFGR